MLTPEIYWSIAETNYKHFQTSRMERFGCSILYVCQGSEYASGLWKI